MAIGRWMDKQNVVRTIPKIEYYSVFKMKEISLNRRIWINLKEHYTMCNKPNKPVTDISTYMRCLK